MASDTFWTRKPIYGRTKYHFVDGCRNHRIWGEARRVGTPIMDLYALRAAPSPTRNRLVETTAGAFSLRPKEPIGEEQPKLTRALVWSGRKSLSTLSTFRVLRKDSHALDIWAYDFFCVQTVLFQTPYVLKSLQRV
jgi:hypothetical protein